MWHEYEENQINFTLRDYLRLLAFVTGFLVLTVMLFSDAHRREKAMEHYNDFESREYLCENYPKLKCEVDRAGMIHMKGMY